MEPEVVFRLLRWKSIFSYLEKISLLKHNSKNTGYSFKVYLGSSNV